MKSILEVVEKVAEAIYRTEGGMTDGDYLQVCGTVRRAWKTDQPWDSMPGVELCEWERDEYRLQARAALETISSMGLLTQPYPPLGKSSAS